MHGSRSDAVRRLCLVQRARLVDLDERDPLTGAPVTDLVLDPDDLTDVSDRLGWEAADLLLVELTERLQQRLCAAGVTTHLDVEHVGIRCIGLAGERTVAADVAAALARPLALGADLVEVRAS